MPQTHFLVNLLVLKTDNKNKDVIVAISYYCSFQIKLKKKKNIYVSLCSINTLLLHLRLF